MAPVHLTIHKTKLGYQVWLDGAPASGYFTSLHDAMEEMKLLDAEERLSPSERQKAWTRKSLKRAGAWSAPDE